MGFLTRDLMSAGWKKSQISTMEGCEETGKTVILGYKNRVSLPADSHTRPFSNHIPNAVR